MVTELITFLSSPILGGLTGMIGTYFTRKEERKLQQLKLDHEFRTLQVQADNTRQELRLKSDIIREEYEGKAFTTSMESQKDMLFWVRPVITFYLLILATYIAYQINTLVGGIETLPMSKLIDLYGQILSAIIYLTITAVTWYFGQRNTKGIQNVFGSKN